MTWCHFNKHFKGKTFGNNVLLRCKTISCITFCSMWNLLNDKHSYKIHINDLITCLFLLVFPPPLKEYRKHLKMYLKSVCRGMNSVGSLKIARWKTGQSFVSGNGFSSGFSGISGVKSTLGTWAKRPELRVWTDTENEAKLGEREEKWTLSLETLAFYL